MRDLHVEAVSESGTTIVLADESGEQFSVPIDDRLRAALRGDRVREGQLQIAMASQLSPRDIQTRVRAGATADEVSEQAGIPVERVLRFAAPVIDERAHVARQARGALLRDESMLELGTLDEVAERALGRRGVGETARWDAWRREDGRWLVACRWVEEHQERTALWVLDSSGGSATPVDDTARELAGMPTSAPSGPARLAVVPTGQHTASPTQDSAAVPEDDTPTGPIPPLVPEPLAAGPGPTHPARRQTRKGGAHDDDDRLRLTDIADNVIDDMAPSPGPGAIGETAGGTDGARRQRPPVPSWDEIMFGRRS